MKKNKLSDVLKKNASYIAVALCIIAVGLAVVFVLLSQDLGTADVAKNGSEQLQPANDVKDNTDVTPTIDPEGESGTVNTVTPEDTPITFIMPVSETTSIEYYTETMAYNSTLKRFSSHPATDFFAAEGTPVFAVYSGVVESVENSLLTGVTVTIDHGNGLKTVYNSLEDAEFISAETEVKQGDIIGYISVTNRQESSDGAHLHFEVTEYGKNVDPAKYLTIDEK